MNKSLIRRYLLLSCLPATAWAAAASADGLAQIAMGLGDGLRRLGRAVLQWLLHPYLSVDGIVLAVSDRRHGLEAWQAVVAHVWTGLSADPAGSAGTMLMWATCAAGSVAVAALLSAGGVRLWRMVSRSRSVPRRTGRVTRLRRARAMREERRRGALGARWAGWQRLGQWLEDWLDTPRLLRRQGVAGAAFLWWRLRRALGRALALGLRQLGQQVAYLALPLALLAGPWIDLGVQRAACGNGTRGGADAGAGGPGFSGRHAGQGSRGGGGAGERIAGALCRASPAPVAAV